MFLLSYIFRKTKLQDVLYKMMRALKKEGYIYNFLQVWRIWRDIVKNDIIPIYRKFFAAFIKDFSEIKIVEYWISKDVRPGRREESG